MYLSKINEFENIKLNYLYKLKSNIGIFFVLIALNIGSLFIYPSGSTTNSVKDTWAVDGNEFSRYITEYAPLWTMFFITAIFIVLVSISIGGKVKKDIEFTLVSSRRSSVISDILFLITITLYSSVSLMFLEGISRLVTYLSSIKISANEAYQDVTAYFKLEFLPFDIFINNSILIFLFLLIIASIAYFNITIYRKVRINHNIVTTIMVVLFIAIEFITIARYGHDLTQFIVNKSIILSIIKCVFISFMLLLSAYFISSKSEVRK